MVVWLEVTAGVYMHMPTGAGYKEIYVYVSASVVA